MLPDEVITVSDKENPIRITPHAQPHRRKAEDYDDEKNVKAAYLFLYFTYYKSMLYIKRATR